MIFFFQNVLIFFEVVTINRGTGSHVV